jgi:Ca2+-binding EF-hand superfamily protein
MTSRALAVLTLVALSLAACAHAPPEDGRGGPGGSRGGHGFGPPPGETGDRGAQRPRLQLFISPAGEPFRAPAEAPYPVAAWFAGADANHDGALSRDEFADDATRFFAVLDVDHDGVIDGFEVSTYETKIAPEILLGSTFEGGGGRGGPLGGGRGAPSGGRGKPGSGGRGGAMGGMMEGAAPYSLLAEPQPVMGADADFNRRITKDEAMKAAKARFTLLDTDKDGVLRLADLPRTPSQGRERLDGGGRRPPEPRG